MIAKTLDRLEAWDARLFDRVFRLRGPALLDGGFIVLSRSGDGLTYVVAVALLLLLHVPGAGAFAATLALAFLVELPVYHVLKCGLKRARPAACLPGVEQAIAPPDEYSFPSGHAAGAVLVAVVASAMYPITLPFVFAWAGAVGLSRVYNGVHFPADVLAGAGLGWACARLALGCIR